MNIILAGIIGRHPYGGVGWCSLMYLLGLRKLGHRVFYLEDTGEANYDPIRNALSKTPEYALRTIHRALAPHGLGDRWCYVDHAGGYHGHTREAWLRVCADADLFLNLSGGCWHWRDEYAAIPHSAYIDSDPAFTQLTIAAAGSLSASSYWPLSHHGALFTFGRNIGAESCAVPTCGMRWHHTWQPVDVDAWAPLDAAPRPAFTTVMSWRIESFTEIGGNKDAEFEKILDLPRRAPAPLELALSCPGSIGERSADVRRLRAHGWAVRDAFEVSHDLDVYRDYLRSSCGELSVAKRTYVATNSGWFSDRTACYLAAGRPAVVQDTGFSRHIPTGEGLFCFRDGDGACTGLERALADYPRHRRAARELARAHFSPDVVLPPLLERATSRGAAPADL